MFGDLNKEQFEAVTHGDGPLLIIAGAGTGKTKVLTSRILYLITEKKVLPKEILAITFTEKATQEMIDRVDRALPLGFNQVCIKTFHGFSDSILRERGLQIGLNTDYQILNNVDQYIFLKKHLFAFDFDYWRPLGNPDKFIMDMASHFSRLREEDINPDKYLEYAQKRQNESGNDLESKQEAKRVLELAKSYKMYQELKIKDNVLDFSDLAPYVLHLFKERPGILREYQNQYRYILVDEFQDTNFVQNKLVFLLSALHKNILVVGDDDQGIYRFRGATVNNILEFEKNFPEAKKIVLKNNYRSFQPILEAAYRLIQHNNPDRLEARTGLNKKLISCVSPPKIDFKPVKIYSFAQLDLEIDFIVKTIKEHVEQNRYQYHDQAVLVRTNAMSRVFIEAFKKAGIPFQTGSLPSLFAQESIKSLLALLTWLTNPDDDIALFKILHLPLFDLKMEQIVSLTRSAKKTSNPLWQILKNQGEKSDLFGNPLKPVIDLLNDLLNFSKTQSVAQVVGRFLYDHGFLEISKKESSLESLQSIGQFSELVAQFEKNHRDHAVFDFVAQLELLENGPDPVTDSAGSLDLSGVTITTIHTAKGLEWPVVFLPSLVNQRFPGVNRKEAIAIPEELLPESLPTGDTHLAEERRLFYVALTRARNEVYLTFSEGYEGVKKWKKSVFLDEIELQVDENPVPTDQPLIIRPTSVNLEEVKKKDSSLINKVSYTQLESFDTCPRKYAYQYVYQLKSQPSHSLGFGSTIHNTLYEFYSRLKKIGSAKVSFNDLEKIYEEKWQALGYLNREHLKLRKKQGLFLLKKFYDINSQPWANTAFLEYSFKLPFGDVILDGRIDRIDKLEDGTYEVIDYKTGRLKEENLKKNLQLSIYALVCDEVLKIPVSKLSLYFLEDNEKISTTRSAADLSQTKEEITAMIEELKKSDFEPQPGFYCQYCDYKLVCPRGRL